MPTAKKLTTSATMMKRKRIVPIPERPFYCLYGTCGAW
jgi:hypothetical protein